MNCGDFPAADEPIRVCDANPHYFSYLGRPTVLITSAEHYGAVINLDFDYVAYLDTLRSYGLNYTRIYPGALIEPYLTGTPESEALAWVTHVVDVAVAADRSLPKRHLIALSVRRRA